MKSDTTGLRVCLTIGAALLGFSLQAAPRQAAAADASDAVQARGVSAVRFHDFSKPIDELPETEWITRWRLQKQDPTAASYRQSAREIQHYLNNPEANAPKSITPEWGKGPRSRFPEPPGPPL
jgi:hypothetical protein